jgi:hypothetical protein
MSYLFRATVLAKDEAGEGYNWVLICLGRKPNLLKLVFERKK